MIRTFMLFALVFSSVSLFAAGSDSWKIVKNGDVCMVTNMHFARTQIPVEQDGKTYYGCCENCKATIQNDKSVRVAEDPYSKKQVDKAKATIAANDLGAVLYFESASNFEKYQKKLKRDGK
jgi:YHS domain-containing protein